MHVDCSMLDSVFPMHERALWHHSIDPTYRPGPTGRDYEGAAPAGRFKGPQGYLTIMCLENQIRGLWAAMGRPELADDPRFSNNRNRLAHRAELNALIDAWLQTFATDDDAVAALEAQRVPCGRVLNPIDAAAHPHLVERGTVRTVHDEFVGDVTVPGFPIRFSDAPPLPDQRVHALGEDNRAVLARPARLRRGAHRRAGGGGGAGGQGPLSPQQVPHEEVARQAGAQLERARLGEQVGGARHHGQAHLAVEVEHRLAVERQHLVVVGTDDEQHGAAHGVEPLLGQVGAAAAGDDGHGVGPALGDRPQGRRGPGGRTDVPDRERRQAGFVPEPAGHPHDPLPEQRHVEALRTVARLVGRQEVDEERGDARLVQHPGHVAVPGAGVAAAGAVREHDRADGALGDAQAPRQRHWERSTSR